jgi:hypothetical protein
MLDPSTSDAALAGDKERKRHRVGVWVVKMWLAGTSRTQTNAASRGDDDAAAAAACLAGCLSSQVAGNRIPTLFPVRGHASPLARARRT